MYGTKAEGYNGDIGYFKGIRAVDAEGNVILWMDLIDG